MNPYDLLYHSIVKYFETEQVLALSYYDEKQLEILFEILGYEMVHLSWYDGPLLNFNDGNVNIGVASCMDSISFSFNDGSFDGRAIALYRTHSLDVPNIDDPIAGNTNPIVGYYNTKSSRVFVTNITLHEKMLLRRLIRYFESKAIPGKEYYFPRLSMSDN